jgi:F-type H+-transporting ATPase subunit epsilon
MQLEVVTPRGTAVTDEADEVTAPGVRGEFGVLPGHTPFVTALKPGVITWKQRGAVRGVYAVGAGFAEVSGHDRIVVLAQSATSADEVDAAQAQKDLDDAERQLKDWKAPDPNAPAAASAPSRETIEAARAWAQARLDAAATAKH